MRRPPSSRDLLERAARAQPAPDVVDLDGWWVRHAPGASWWIGTVLPHADPGDLERRIDEVEAFYAARHAVARFQIAPGAAPDGLDDALARRRYARVADISLQIAATVDAARLVVPAGFGVRYDDGPSPTWCAVRSEVSGHDADAERAVAERVALPSACVTVTDAAGDAVAVGRTVLDGGWAGVFSMATRPAARGRGAGRAVLGALARWAAARGGDRMYLQVECGNPVARRLYAGAGFTELVAHHYRVGVSREPGRCSSRAG